MTLNIPILENLIKREIK